MILHGLRALRDTLQQDKELNINNCSIAIVGKDHSFTSVEGGELQRWLDMLAVSEAGGGGGGGAAAPDAAVPAPDASAAPADTPAAMDIE